MAAIDVAFYMMFWKRSHERSCERAVQRARPVSIESAQGLAWLHKARESSIDLVLKRYTGKFAQHTP